VSGKAASNAKATAEALIARIADDLNGPLTPAIMTAAIAEVTDAIEHDLAVDDVEAALLTARLSGQSAPKA
jgi:hypothetical protein